MAQKSPKRGKFVYKIIVKIVNKLKQKNIKEVQKKLLKRGKNLPEPDRKYFDNIDNCSISLELMGASLHQGIVGPSHESVIFARPWGFELEDITIRVHSWHGELDTSVPLRMAKEVCKAIPNCEMKIYENMI